MEKLAASVRFAQADDVAAIADLVNASNAPIDPTVPAAQPMTAQQVSAMVSARQFVVLDDDRGALAAVVSVEPRVGDGDATAPTTGGRFAHLSVHPTRQGQRLGTRMVAIAEAMCQAMGCATVVSTIDSEAAARGHVPSWYRRMGYADSGAASSGVREMRKALVAGPALA